MRYEKKQDVMETYESSKKIRERAFIEQEHYRKEKQKL